MQWLFFGRSGRIGRRTYFLSWLFWLAIAGFGVGRVLANSSTAEGTLTLWSVAVFASALMSTVSIVMLTVKRLHDMGYPGHLAFCLFIPVLSPVAFLFLCFWPSDPDENAYGMATDEPA